MYKWPSSLWADRQIPRHLRQCGQTCSSPNSTAAESGVPCPPSPGTQQGEFLQLTW